MNKMNLTIPCALCGSTNHKHFDTRSFRGQKVTNLYCTQCGLVFESPRLSDGELEAFYEAEYRQVYQGQGGPITKDLIIQKARAQSLLAFTSPHIKKLEHHLDIGCSSGLLLETFRSAYNCVAAGIEPGKDYRAHARLRGLDVFESLEALGNVTDPIQFGLISMAHVLEHIPDPVGYLICLRETWLAPGGLLLLEVPNLYAHDSFEIAHLYSFSAHTLAQVLGKAGFVIIKQESHGRPRSNLIPLYITVLARSAGPVPRNWQVTPESNVKLKRFMGMLRRKLLTRFIPGRAWNEIVTK